MRTNISRKENQWYLASRAVPCEKNCFELVTIVNTKGKQFQGWWTGKKWEGRDEKKFGTIRKWKYPDSGSFDRSSD